MDRDNKTKRKTNPRSTTNIFSRLSFFYTLKLFVKGYRQGLESGDVYEVLPSFRSKEMGDRLEKQWRIEENDRTKPSICHALWICFGKIYLSIGAILFAMKITMTVWSPEAQSKLISYFSPNQTKLTKNDAIFYACVVIGLKVGHLIVAYNCRIALVEVFLGMKSAVSGLLYRKSLKLTPESLSEVTAGKISTIIIKDLDALEMIVASANELWISLFQTAMTCYLIYCKIGLASFAGILFFLVVLPVQMFIGAMAYKLRLECSGRTDERLELIKEVLSAIKVVKMYTWEKFFEKKIGDARKHELRKLHKLFYTKVWIGIIGTVSSKLAFFIFLMTYVWMGNNVSAEVVYYILSCFNNLEESLSNIPFGFSSLFEVFAVAHRVESVLVAEELTPKPLEVECKTPKIILKKVSVKVLETKVFENVSTTISQGLNVVVGRTGSGKTTLLKVIMRDCPFNGEIKTTGTISYASQEPWLFPSTIRNNILFGEEFCEERYKAVLKICSLNRDLKLFDNGDTTIVAERGINLSKGQQARVNLARAVYKKSDIYLLDDCLASLDPQVSNSVFQECIVQFLRGKLCVFVTNNLDHAHRADRVLVVNRGSIEFTQKMKPQPMDENTISSEQYDGKIEEIAETKQLYHEYKKCGKVDLRDYHGYVVHGGGVAIFSVIIALFVAAQSAVSYSDKLLSQWVTLEHNLSSYTAMNQSSTEYQTLYDERTSSLRFYVIVAITSIVLSLIRLFAFFAFARLASISMHKAMVRNVLNSTMRFFDSHLIGNILTRFSKDFVTVDETIPFVMIDCLLMIFTASGGVILLTTVDLVFFLELLVVFVLANVFKHFSQPAGRNLERLHVAARSPTLGHLNSTLEGLSTIRASRAENIVSREFDNHLDLFASALYMVCANFIAISFGLELLGTIFISVVFVQFLVTGLDTSVGDVGLAITQSLVIVNIITSGITSVADCENLMVSVERILEFTRLEEEDNRGKILIGWPKDGSVNFDHVSMTYTSRLMLNDINFKIQPRERLAIVGRTGAGKSSIISSLMRLYPTQGTITLDGVNTQEVSLNWLRSNISVIPQDPYVFSGTIRENLDPLGRFKDDQIWKVLCDLRLNTVIEDLGVRVDKGATLSAGQKQLLCLARVILRKNKIVVLDEATANVDDETDALIQEAVQNNFAQSTVIIITHRLLSVKSCHKVVVLDEGKIKEFGEPMQLLQNKNGFFQSVNK